MNRSVTRLVLMCCVIVSIQGTLGVTHAQQVRAEPGIQAFRPHTALRPVATAFRATPIPIRIERIETARSVQAGETFAASVIANVESAGLPIRAEWDLGDGQTREGLSIRHTYERPGTYNVTLRLRNPAGEEVRHMRIRVLETEDG